MSESCLLETTKMISEILGFLGAAGFFGYKLISGHFIVNAGISAKLERAVSTEKDDYLTVSATRRKGSQGSLEIHDAKALFGWSGGGKEVELVGFKRLTYRTDKDKTARKRVRNGL